MGFLFKSPKPDSLYYTSATLASIEHLILFQQTAPPNKIDEIDMAAELKRRIGILKKYDVTVGKQRSLRDIFGRLVRVEASMKALGYETEEVGKLCERVDGAIRR